MNDNIKSPIISLNVYDIKNQKKKMSLVEGRPFCSLSYRKHGTIKLNIEDKTFISKPDYITFIPKNKEYYTEITEDTHLIAIHFNALDESMFTKTFIIKNDDRQLQQLFDLALKSYSAENDNNYEAYACFYQILSRIEKHFIMKKESRVAPAVSMAKSYIDKSFEDADFNIDSLVSRLPISASHLRSEFSKAYSVTPIEYLKYVRLQHAITLLASNLYSIDEIAEKSGYNSTSYFIQSFRKSTGFPPLKYKEKFLIQEK